MEFDEELHGGEDYSTNPETVLLRKADITAVRQAIESLPPEYREVIILRELEDCAYKEIADIMQIDGPPQGKPHVLEPHATINEQFLLSLASCMHTCRARGRTRAAHGVAR